MRLDIHVHIHSDTDRKVDQLSELIVQTHQNQITMANELQDLTTEVQETRGIMQSAKAAIEGFAVKLDEAIRANDPQALITLRDELNASSEDLAAAIAANPLPGDGGTQPVDPNQPPVTP